MAEARLLAQFDHPSLLKVYRFWQERGTTYMVMPFYRGDTLRQALAAIPGGVDEGWLLRIMDGMIYRCAIDKHWTMLLLSDGCKNITGYSADEICNNRVISFEQLTELEDRESVRNVLNAAIVEQSPFTLEYRIRCKDGSTSQ